MTKSMNKLQIRVELLNAVKRLESGEKHTTAFLEDIISPLKEITDIDAVLDILIKEIISNQSDNRFFILAFLLEKLIPQEKLEDELWKLLNTKEIKDTVKSNIINILKDLGNQINYEKYSEYFEDPNAVIDADTAKLLKNAIYNPEVLIDFLDFIEALTDKDRTILIDSISEDYKGDELANLFAPVVYSNPNTELSKYAIKRLGDSKSALAVAPLQYVIKYASNEETKAVAKKSLTALKLAGNRECKEKAFFEQVYSTSEIDDVYISMPDGRGNVGIIVGRKKSETNSICMFAVVLNNIIGIVDCFGFNDISNQEYSRIINKFYMNQEKICIPAYIAKMLLNQAEELSRQTIGKISYEYICWKRLLIDVPELSYDLKTALEKRVMQIEVDIKDLRKIYSTSILDKWFFFNSENKGFDNLIEKIIAILQDKNAENNIPKICELINTEKSNVWTNKDIEQINFRLLLSAYLLSINGFQSYADILNSIRFNNDILNELLTNIIRVSIYEFLLREREKYLNTNISTNIFSRRNEANKCFIDKKILDATILSLETEWSF